MNHHTSPAKSPSPVAVICELKDCMYHEGPAPGYKGYSLCSHPHKKQYLLGECPLYRLDWVKKLKMAQKPS